MRSEKIEKYRPLGWNCQLCRPFAQVVGIAANKRIQYQDWERKLIDHLRFVVSVPKVTDIVAVRHIGFGNDGDVRSDGIKHIPQ